MYHVLRAAEAYSFDGINKIVQKYAVNPDTRDPRMRGWLTQTHSREDLSYRVESVIFGSNELYIQGCFNSKQKPLGIVWQVVLIAFPRNCGTLVSGNLVVRQGLRGLGLGRLVMEAREIARDANMSMLTCTTNGNSPHHEKMLSKQGWVMATSFVNAKTDNLCKLWHKVLTRMER